MNFNILLIVLSDCSPNIIIGIIHNSDSDLVGYLKPLSLSVTLALYDHAKESCEEKLEPP